MFKEPVNFQSNGTSISNTNGTGTPLLKKTARKKPSSFTPRFDVPEVIDLDDDEPNKAPENQHPEFGNVKQATDQFLKGIFTSQCSVRKCKFTFTKKIFRQINYLLISLVKPLLSRSFC